MEYTHHSNNYYFLNIQESVTTEGSGEGIFECCFIILEIQPNAGVVWWRGK